MNTRLALALVAPLLAAAAPPQSLSLQVVPSPKYPFTARAPAPPRPSGPVYEPAPLPNPDITAPRRAESQGTEISPSLFNRRDQFRGDSFLKGDSVQSDQDRRMRPSAGFKLRMPLQPETPQ